MFVSCQENHETHSTIEVGTRFGTMSVFDWDKYKDSYGYCEGKCDVSRTIRNIGEWEPLESKVIETILKEKSAGVFVDIGCNVGWYTLMAANFNYRVYAYEASPEVLAVCRFNCALNGFDTLVNFYNIWVDKDSKFSELKDIEEITLLKADIEGKEPELIIALESLLEARKINNLYLEISPVFNGAYPLMVHKLVKYGYEVFCNGGTKKFDGDFNFIQDNFLFVLR